MSTKNEDPLESCRNLEVGWDSYSAEPPSSLAISKATEFLKFAQLAGVEPVKADPSVIGGVGISYFHPVNGYLAYVEFYNDGDVLSLMENGSKNPDINHEEPNVDDYAGLLNRIQVFMKKVEN